MTEFGYFLSSEEHGPRELVEQAKLAEQHGMGSVWISDHFHPWLDEQGQSPFVWTVIGGIAATTSLRVTTAVTCPIMRIHPVITAQAAATAASMLDGRFRLGVGSGESLNEHVLGDRWPAVDVRLEMLEEAVEVMRKLWTGDQITWSGKHYEIDRARIYTLPKDTIEVPVSGFGPKATELAARIADGFVTTSPDEKLLSMYRDNGGKGPSMAGVKVCWAPDEEDAVTTAHRLWRSSVVSGELAQELPAPAHFDQAAELVTREQVKERFACGPDPERHVEALRPYLEAGLDEVYVSQIGGHQAEFLDFFDNEVKPRL
jgi:G6PDH family F420-dependent oxidoreductase